MKTDLSRSLRLLLDSAVDRARSLERSGSMRTAAQAWDEVARLSELLAEQAATTADRDRRHGVARAARQTATNLRERDFLSAKSPLPRTENETAVDEHRQSVRGLIHRSTITWDDIAGLEETKKAAQMAYALSLATRPDGVQISPVRSILLYGPPGNGKSLLAAACSNALEATFFNVKVSHLLSKYFGESSKLITALYDEARAQAPSVVFLDEVDALTGTRRDEQAGPDRRLLANLLSELDGVGDKGGAPFVMTLAATNTPWAIDPAVLSRFERKIFIPLPDATARGRILKLQLTNRGYQVEGGLDHLVGQTEGYSGRELERLCKLLVERMFHEQNPELSNAAAGGRAALASYQIRVTAISCSIVTTILQENHPETSTADLRPFLDFAQRNS
jgi:katanin p60 ATPase-containing subunit A1